MIHLTGYSDRFSARIGESLEFKISSAAAAPYRAHLVRIRLGDPNPSGPGQKILDLHDVFETVQTSRTQHVYPGSYMIAPVSSGLALDHPFTIAVRVKPSLVRDTHCVMSRTDATGRGFRLDVTTSGVCLTIGREGAPPVLLSTRRPLSSGHWYEIQAAIDPANGEISLSQRGLAVNDTIRDDDRVEMHVHDPAVAATAPLTVGAAAGVSAVSHFNGRIEDPMLIAGWPGRAMPKGGPREVPSLLLGFDFSVGMDTAVTRGMGSHAVDGKLINLPMRAVRGSHWSGDEMCWRHAPREYAAIAFHDDDLYDCGWETDFVFEVPDNLRSGLYGMKLTCEGRTDIIPFFIRPARGVATAALLWLAPTDTYLAYGNMQRGLLDDPAYWQRVAGWNCRRPTPEENPEFGASLYNRHSDSSGIAYASRLRPILTMRPDFVHTSDPKGSGMSGLGADTYLLDWLEAKSIPYDVATDEDLEGDGAALLKAYTAVATGGHPEYHTRRTLDAFQEYVDSGGRLLYLGGNGFFERIARSTHYPGAIEVRRAEGAYRPYEAAPGEYYHSFSGEYGGLWRRNGRPPQRLVGVGYTGQSTKPSASYYRRRPESYDPTFSWIFEGIGEEILGNFGFMCGGAAGTEIDRLDIALGSPRNAVILARSERHESFVPAFEELLTTWMSVNGEPPEDLVRGEIVYFDTPAGGAVFSVGSMTFLGSLPWADYRNPISRLLENVVLRFTASQR
jgi:N,N-dimethylformamidase